MIDRKWIGHELPPSVLPIERSRLQFFAKAIGETDPVYTDAAAARDAGYPDLPAPPTFLFAAELDSARRTVCWPTWAFRCRSCCTASRASATTSPPAWATP